MVIKSLLVCQKKFKYPNIKLNVSFWSTGLAPTFLWSLLPLPRPWATSSSRHPVCCHCTNFYAPWCCFEAPCRLYLNRVALPSSLQTTFLLAFSRQTRFSHPLCTVVYSSLSNLKSLRFAFAHTSLPCLNMELPSSFFWTQTKLGHCRNLRELTFYFFPEALVLQWSLFPPTLLNSTSSFLYWLLCFAYCIFPDNNLSLVRNKCNVKNDSSSLPLSFSSSLSSSFPFSSPPYSFLLFFIFS